MKIIKKMIKNFILGMGCVGIGMLFVSEELFKRDFMLSLSIVIAIIAVSGALIFKKGVSPLSLWVRRGSMMVIGGASTFTAFYISNIFTAEQFVVFMPTVLASMIISSLTGYIVLDTLERKKLKRINEKLEKTE